MRILLIGLAWAAFFFALGLAHAHDPEEPELDVWYMALRQPDAPHVSCCGKADAYFCDILTVEEGQTFCTITDTRDDESRGRPHIDVGTRIPIPANKFGPGKWGNPTGHNVVFLSAQRWVYCFVQGAGT